MNTFMNALKANNNFAYTENGAIKHKTTHSDLLDMFALGGAYRKRSDDDVKLLMRNAFKENPTYALKCLFYLRDVRGGQGERRFFRVAIKDLVRVDKEAVRRNLIYIPEFGRWDDLYVFVGTPLEKDAMEIIKNQLILDVQCKTPSLLAKWLKSENTSSYKSRQLGAVTRRYLQMSHKQYRKTLAILRTRINVLEKLMSENRWDEIEFDKIPSKAGMRYKNAFARHDLEREKVRAMTYADFAKDTSTKVNASTLNPADIASEIFSCYSYPSETQRLMWDKYWKNLKDYYNGNVENGIAIVDTSGSMRGKPLAAAVSMGAYIAERGNGPFKDHFITFSTRPELIKFKGVDIYDKFQRASRASWGMNTNIEAVFDMLLNTIRRKNVSADDVPKTLYIFSDMEFDRCTVKNGYNSLYSDRQVNTLLESIAEKWASYGYELPKLIFWNVNARTNNIPALGGRFAYVSGFNMNMVETILSTNKDGYALMMEKLNTERYACIR